MAEWLRRSQAKQSSMIEFTVQHFETILRTCHITNIHLYWRQDCEQYTILIICT